MAAAQLASRALSNLLRNAAVDRALPLLRSLARAAADTVFPPACLNCRQSTGAVDSLCAACWAQVRFIERPFCERLGTPFAMDLGSEGLLSARGGRQSTGLCPRPGGCPFRGWAGAAIGASAEI
jgi:Double zinc ribbon domain